MPKNRYGLWRLLHIIMLGSIMISLGGVMRAIILQMGNLLSHLFVRGEVRI